MADQWDMNSLWESRNVWLPIKIDDREGSLEVVWHDIYDLNVSVSLSVTYALLTRCSKTGEWEPIQGKAYIAKHAQTAGDAYLQEAVSLPRPVDHVNT